MVDAFFGKKYKLTTSEHFDDVMKAMGVGLVTRKMGNAVSPVMELKKEGDEYVLSSTSTFKNTVQKFTPGVEMDDETPDGRKVKTVFTIEGDKIHEKQVQADGKVTNIERTFSNDEVNTKITYGDITCTRMYKLQA